MQLFKNNQSGRSMVEMLGVLAIFWEVSNNNSFDVCLNIANVVKQFHEHLLYTAITKTTADSSSTQFDTKYFGDKYCQNYTCISKLTMNNISKQCEYCKDSQACTYIIAFITD
jgi:hypothetical protein